MSHFEKVHPDVTTVQRGGINLFLLVISVFLAFWALRIGHFHFMVGIVLLPFLPGLMQRTDLLVFSAVFFDAANLLFAGITGATYGMFPRLILVVPVFLSVLLRRDPAPIPLPEKRPMVAFIFIIIVLMAVRGTGLRVFGGRMWGGMIYIVLLTSILFALAAPWIRVSKKTIFWMVWGAFVAGILGSVLQYQGLVTDDEWMVMGARMQWLRPFIGGAIPLLIAIKIRRWIRGVLLLFCLFLISLTGFRSSLANMMIILFSVGFFISGLKRLSYLFKAGVAGVLCWVSLVLIAPFLPLGAQRAVSFFPGIEVEEITVLDAQASTEWRFVVWRYAIERSGPYLIIGRGSGFDVMDVSGQLSARDIASFTPWRAYHTKNYHSGPVTLLVDYGIPGFLAGIALAILAVKRFWRYAPQMAQIDTFESRYALFLCCYLIWHWISFFLVFGAMPTFSKLIADSGVAIIVVNSILMAEKKEAGVEERGARF